MDCENCGRTNVPEARFCPACGIGLGAAAMTQSGSGSIPTRGLGALLEEAFRVYRANFWQFVAIAAIPAAVNVLSSLFFAAGESPLARLGIIFTLASIVLSIITAGAIAFGVARHATRGEVDIVDCLSHAFRVGIFLIVQAIVFTMIIGGLLIVGVILIATGVLLAGFEAWGGGGETGAALALLVIGGLLLIPGIVVAIWLGVRWFSASYAVLIEGKGPIAGLGRSWNLVTGSWWRVFGIGLIVVIIVTGVIMVIAIPVGIIGAIIGNAAAGEGGAAFVGALGGSLATVLVTPFAYIAGALLYFDLRVRKEGFDLDALTAETSGA